MQQMKKAINVEGKLVFDMESILASLLVVGQQRGIELKKIFKSELRAIPPAIPNLAVWGRRQACLGQAIRMPLWKWPSFEFSISSCKSGVITCCLSINWCHCVKCCWEYEGWLDSDEYRYDGVSGQDHERQRIAGGGAAHYNLLFSSLPGHDNIIKKQ